MKILCITSVLNGNDGWGRYSIDLIGSLQKSGHQIEVICYKSENRYKINQFDILSNPLSFTRNYIFSYISLYKCMHQIKKFNPDIIHCMVETYSPIAYFISLILNKKYIITVHGSFALKPFINPLYSILQSYFYKKAKHIIAVSNYTKKRLLEKLPSIKIDVINNGIGSYFIDKSTNHKDLRENIIIGVGGIKHRKGFHQSIRAFAEILKKFPDYKYYIIGNSSDKKYVDYINGIIKDLGINDNVSILSNLSDEDLVKIYRKSKLFVLTSISDKFDFEGFGLVYLEAGTFGIPSIGSYNSGAEDAILDGKTGLLANSDNISDIATKITMVLGNDILYNSLSVNAKRHAEEMLWDNKVKEYIKLYI